MVTVGGSCIIDPFGNMIASPNFEEETTLIADIDLDDIPRAKYDLDAVGRYACPDVFRLLVNESSQTVFDGEFGGFSKGESTK